jgi:zinc transporter ZupT
MLLPLSIAVGSVALGTLLGLLRREHGALVRAIQTLALAAAVWVALGDLLPQALDELGGWALVAFAIPVPLPALARRALGPGLRASAGGSAGLELGYAALVLHRVVDGMVLGMYGGAGVGALRPPLLLAVGAHEVPISAAVALRFTQRDGIGPALVRAAGLALSSCAGVLLTGQAPAALLQRIDPWAQAVIAGLLVHIAWSEWRGRRAREPRPALPQPLAPVLRTSRLPRDARLQ